VQQFGDLEKGELLHRWQRSALAQCKGNNNVSIQSEKNSFGLKIFGQTQIIK